MDGWVFKYKFYSMELFANVGLLYVSSIISTVPSPPAHSRIDINTAPRSTFTSNFSFMVKITRNVDTIKKKRAAEEEAEEKTSDEKG